MPRIPNNYCNCLLNIITPIKFIYFIKLFVYYINTVCNRQNCISTLFIRCCHVMNERQIINLKFFQVLIIFIICCLHRKINKRNNDVLKAIDL